MSVTRIARFPGFSRSFPAVLAALSFVTALGSVQAKNPDRYIAVLKNRAEDPGRSIQAIERQHPIDVAQRYRHVLRGFSFISAAATAGAIANRPEVAYVVPDTLCRAIGQSLPTGVDRTDTDLAVPIDGQSNDLAAGVTVAVVDTGLDIDHPDLNVVGGKRFFLRGRRVASDDNYDDDNGHGTHVGGTIGAVDNGLGVVGTAPGVDLYAVKVLDADGSGYVSVIVAGIDHIASLSSDGDPNNDIHVANVSLGGSYNQALNDAVHGAVDHGVVVAVAAGNNAADAANYSPASAANALTVSALADSDGAPGGTGSATSYGSDDYFASFSNYGSVIDLCAPGVDILSTYPGGYAVSSGTSMAAPHVAGAAALYIANSADPYAGKTGLDAANVVRQALLDTGWKSGDAEYLLGGDRDGIPEPLLNIGALAALFGDSDSAPEVSITSPGEGSSFESGATISFEGSASDAEDGDLTSSLVWTSDIDGQIGTGGSFTATLSDGSHFLTASVTDSAGLQGSASVSVSVASTTASDGTVSVTGIDYSTSGGRFGDKHLSVDVNLADDNGSPVSGASVSVEITNSTQGVTSTGQTTTDSNGTAMFEWKSAPSGNYSVVVTEVTASGFAWDGVTPENAFVK